MALHRIPARPVTQAAVFSQDLESIPRDETIGLASPTGWLSVAFGIDDGARSASVPIDDVIRLRDALSLEQLSAERTPAEIAFSAPSIKDVEAISRALIVEEQMTGQRSRFAVQLAEDMAHPGKVVLAASDKQGMGLLVYDRALFVKRDEAVLFTRVFELGASTPGLVPLLETAYAAQQRLDIETAITSLIAARRFPHLDLVVSNGEGADFDLAPFERLNERAWASAFDGNSCVPPPGYVHPDAPGLGVSTPASAVRTN